MKRVIIVHQWMAGANGDWRPWLKLELEKLGYEVLLPEMPDIDEPVIEKWVSYLAKTVGQPNVNTYFVGHSIGCQAILRYLETINARVGGAVFVAGWFDLAYMEDEEVERIAKPWITSKINFDKIRQILPKSAAILSDNDVYVDLYANKSIFENQLGSEVTVMHNAGHLTAEDGFIKLPKIIEQLEKL